MFDEDLVRLEAATRSTQIVHEMVRSMEKPRLKLLEAVAVLSAELQNQAVEMAEKFARPVFAGKAGRV